MADKISVYITEEQHEWLNKQPRSFSFSAQVRLLLDALKKLEYIEQALEIDLDEIKTA
jgi:hypothetical protein